MYMLISHSCHFEIERDSGGKNPGITDNAFDFQLEAAATYTTG